ncbi:MAG TPA: RES family NAD+ phosphorylase [Chloroflexota bacterium]
MGSLFRVGHCPDPLAWPDWRYVGDQRFDDPLHLYRVLYLAEQRLACYVEGLAPLRVPLDRLTSGPHLLPRVPAEWRQRRCVGQVRLLSSQRWMDLRRIETAEALRAELAPLLRQLGLPDLDVSVLRGPSRPLTRAVGRWAYDAGFQGIAYRSRFHDALDCWAIFEGAAFERVGNIAAVSPDDPDLQTAAALFGLAV